MYYHLSDSQTENIWQISTSDWNYEQNKVIKINDEYQWIPVIDAKQPSPKLNQNWLVKGYSNIKVSKLCDLLWTSSFTISCVSSVQYKTHEKNFRHKLFIICRLVKIDCNESSNSIYKSREPTCNSKSINIQFNEYISIIINWRVTCTIRNCFLTILWSLS